MQIKKVHMKNFRSFQDCEVHFDDYSVLVGVNGAGKSTVLYALNIFFRETENSNTDVSTLSEEDFHARNTAEPIEITITFGDLSEEALETFSEYARQDVLIVTAKATFDNIALSAKVQQFGQRLVMEDFTEFFELYNNGESANRLKAIYNEIRKEFPELPEVSTKDGNRDALRAYEAKHSDKCVLIPSEDQFYGFSRGKNRLAKHIQWVYIPAVKDATEEQFEAKNTALGKILSRTVRAKVKFEDQIEKLRQDTLEEYRKILASQQSTLDGVSQSLSNRLGQWAHPKATARLEWAEDAKKSVQVQEPNARIIAGEGEFEGDLAHFGHGLQRSYLLALLQELANVDDKNAPKLILGCEEPELYQHPPQAKHLSNVLQELSIRNSQVIVTTHSPYFVSGRYFEKVRVVRRDSVERCSNVFSISSNAISERIAEITGKKPIPSSAQRALLHQVLQPNLNEMFFTSKLILVEGLEDMAYINSWMIITGRWEEYRRGGCHIVPVNGKNYLIESLIIAQTLEIPVFVIFDADGNKKDNASQKKFHERDNGALLRLLGGDDTNLFPSTILWGKNYTIWPINFAKSLKEEVETANEGLWDKTYSKATKGLGSPEGTYQKNTIHIGDHLTLLKDKGITIPSLDRLCSEILRFSKQ